jgi:hypothetical protein
MMKRRKFLASLAALPFVASILPAPKPKVDYARLARECQAHTDSLGSPGMQVPPSPPGSYATTDPVGTVYLSKKGMWCVDSDGLARKVWSDAALS